MDFKSSLLKSKILKLKDSVQKLEIRVKKLKGRFVSTIYFQKDNRKHLIKKTGKFKHVAINNCVVAMKNYLYKK